MSKNDYKIEDRGHSTPCWVWQKWTTADGYGHKSHRGKTHLAHRVYYMQRHGDDSIPEGAHLDHLCRTRSCVNPDHLEPVTHKENHRRRSRFTQRQADELRLLRAKEKLSQSTLAERFEISRRYVRDILEGKCWIGTTWEQEASLRRA